MRSLFPLFAAGVLAALLSVTSVGSIAHAEGEDASEPVPEDSPFRIDRALVGDRLLDESRLSLRGWLSQGFTFNGDASGGNFNGPLSFNDRANEYQLNQLYFVLERPIDRTKNDFDLGGRVDLLFGTDAAFTQAVGLDDQILGDSTSRFYKLALPQFYLEALVPIGSGLTVKAGHFYTLIGYEVVTAPDNFFYSHAYTMQYGEPFTHTGVLASYTVAESVTTTVGITRGWDNFSDSGRSPSFLGSVAWSGEGRSLTLGVTTGNEATALNRTMYSLVYIQELGEDWKWALQHDWGYQEQGAPSGGPAHWYGVNQYLTYRLSDSWSAGARAEWFRDQDGTRVAGLRSASPAAPGDFFGLTLGLNYAVTGNLTIRPEVRYDYQRRSDRSAAAAFGDADSVNQWTAAVDGILRF